MTSMEPRDRSEIDPHSDNWVDGFHTGIAEEWMLSNDLRKAAQAVLDTLDRSSSFNVEQVDALRAALGQEQRDD